MPRKAGRPVEQEKTSDDQFEALLRKNSGVLLDVAADMRCSRQNVWQRAQSPRFQEVIAQIEEEKLDLGEGHIAKDLREGERSTVKWYMERKGKNRGYGNRVETAINDAQLEAFLFAIGGDAAKLRALRNTINPEEPGK